MVLFCVAGGLLGRLFSPRSSLGLLLLAVAQILLANGGQQVGVSLKFQGVTLPSDSFVDFDDILNVGHGSSNIPSNINPRAALLCVTDLIDCCASPHTVRGGWYFPNGNQRVGFGAGGSAKYQANRGPNEEINGQTVYGSVRLYRRYSPPERGRFRCELPSATNSSDQILYVNIVNFGFRFDVDNVIISSSTGSTATTAGETDYSLTCSSTLFEPSHLPSGVPSPNFQWSINGSASLPSGVTATATVMSSSNSTSETYTSTLQFSALSQSYTGMYTCRLGPGRLMNSAMVTVNAPAISVQITSSKAPMLGLNDYSLTCGVTGTENLNSSITYQWTKNNGTQIQIVGTNSNTLFFFRLRPSDAGLYSCNVTVLLAYVSIVVYASKSFEVTIIIPGPTVSVHSDSPNPILSGFSPTLTCTVEMKSTVNVPVTVSMDWTGPDGTAIVPTTGPEMISFTLYSSSYTLDSVELADSGEYMCTVKIENEPEVYTRTNITIVDGVFQLRLKSVGICQQWYSENSDKSEQYSNFIKGALVKAIERRCKCRFPIINLLKEDSFICEDSPNVMIYRNALLGTHNFNGTQTVNLIQDWVSTGPLIKIDGNSVRVDSSCPTAISFLDEPVCGEKKEECLYDYNPNYVKCAQHLDDNNVANCFEGCVVRNG